MQPYSFTHVADHVLLRALSTTVSQDRATTATMLAQIAEVDARGLYRPAACDSMYSYCLRELGMSEDVAAKRIRAARTARQFPAIFAALADGRLNLSAVLLLGAHLTKENSRELLESATFKSNAEIEQLLAERFPSGESLALVTTAGSTLANFLPAARPVVPSDSVSSSDSMGPVSAEQVEHPVRFAPRAEEPRAKATPVGAGRYELRVMVDQETLDALQEVRDLLGHASPGADLVEVVKRSALALRASLRKRKFGLTDKPRAEKAASRSAANRRHIPAHMRRTVFERDGGRCTFVSATGRRCDSRTRLEFDHVRPVACGGPTSVENLRLRCRAHNQLAAEQSFGAKLMRSKRELGSGAPSTTRVPRTPAQGSERDAELTAAAVEVIPWLATLGFAHDEA